MFRTMCKSKIYGATVTGAVEPRPGSVVVDPDLMDAADLLAGERVLLIDGGTNGQVDVDVVAGPRGSGVFECGTRRGAAMTLVSTILLDGAAARTHRVVLVTVDAENRIVVAPSSSGSTDRAQEPAEPAETVDAARLDALIAPGVPVPTALVPVPAADPAPIDG